MNALWRFIGSLLIGALGSLLGSEFHNSSPRLARQLVLGASKRLPEDERQDYLDEMIDLIDCFAEEGLKLSAIAVGLNEWLRTATPIKSASGALGRLKGVPSIFAWLGGADLKTLRSVPEERNQFVLTGMAVLLMPTIGATGMGLRVASMTDLGSASAILIAGPPTFLVLLVLEVTIVRTIKNPMRLPTLLPIPQATAQKRVELDVNSVLDYGRGSRNWLLDLLRVVLSLAIGVVTAHAILELLYTNDIEALKVEQVAHEREMLTNELLYGVHALDVDRAAAVQEIPLDQRNGLVHHYGTWMESADTIGQPATDVEILAHLHGPIAINTPDLAVLTAQSWAVRHSVNSQLIPSLSRLADRRDNLHLNFGRDLDWGSGWHPLDYRLRAIDSQIESIERDIEAARAELSELDFRLAHAFGLTSGELDWNRRQFESALSAYTSGMASIDAQTSYDGSISASERTTLFLEVVVGSAGSLIVAVLFMAAFMAIDTLPYSLKRMYRRAHDTMLILDQHALLIEAKQAHTGRVIAQVARDQRDVSAILDHRTEADRPTDPSLPSRHGARSTDR